MKTEKEKKPERVTLEIPVGKRAAGYKLPLGNPTIIAKGDVNVAKLPINLAALFEKIAKHGKDGVKLSILAPKTAEGRYARWLIRILGNLGHVRAVEETKEEKASTKKSSEKKSSGKAPKALTIAKAAARKSAKRSRLAKAA
jgi:hypothetical protein